MAKVNVVKWYEHVLRRDDGHVLRKALEFEGKGKRKRGQPKKMWKMQVEKESKNIGLEEEDAMNKMESGSRRDCCLSGVNPATPIFGGKSGHPHFRG